MNQETVLSKPTKTLAESLKLPKLKPGLKEVWDQFLDPLA